MRKLCIGLFLAHSFLGFSQSDSTQFFAPSKAPKLNRIIGVVSSEVVGYSVTTVALNSLWYKDFPRTKFHFFNDNKEWLQMDKFGHATTAYYVGYLGMKSLDWAGVKKNKSIFWGGSLGFIFLSSVEVLDGFSSAWGASVGDIIANTAGVALLIGQELAWKEQRIMLKYSTHFSDYAVYRPNLLGGNWKERLLKDYNGQTYWTSVNIKSFIGRDSKIPNWLNLAIGYSANGMIGGFENPTMDINGNTLPSFERYRQYFLSLDIDLNKIKTKSPFVNTLLGTFGFIKFPFPTLEYNKVDGFRGHLIYF